MFVALRHPEAITTQELSEAFRGWLENPLVLNNVKIYTILELRKICFSEQLRRNH